MTMKSLCHIHNKQANKKLQNMNIISIDHEKYYFLNMCNLCRYDLFSQAQSHINFFLYFVHIICCYLSPCVVVTTMCNKHW